MNPQVAGMSIGNATLAFMTFLPAPDVLMDNTPNRQYRINEAAAVAVSVGVGVALAFAAGDASPLVFAVVTSAALVAATEYLLHCNSEHNTTAEKRMI